VKVLAIDTTTSRGSVAVVDESGVLGEVRLTVSDAHSTHVLPAVDFLLKALDLPLEALDGLAAAVGPGSFTGLRVGIGTVQGLSLGSGRPVLGVVTLDALAFRIRGSAEHLVALMDGYSQGVYVGLYDREARPTEAPRLTRLEDLVTTLPPGAAFLGEAADRGRGLIEAHVPDASFPVRSLFLAGAIGQLARVRLAMGEGGAAETLHPVYLRAPQIGQPRP
jgi:tRNA threonylcarbamoyladenosine biosynthesis protein TsaB